MFIKLYSFKFFCCLGGIQIAMNWRQTIFSLCGLAAAALAIVKGFHDWGPKVANLIVAKWRSSSATASHWHSASAARLDAAAPAIAAGADVHVDIGDSDVQWRPRLFDQLQVGSLS